MPVDLLLEVFEQHLVVLKLSEQCVLDLSVGVVGGSHVLLENFVEKFSWPQGEVLLDVDQHLLDELVGVNLDVLQIFIQNRRLNDSGHFDVQDRAKLNELGEHFVANMLLVRVDADPVKALMHILILILLLIVIFLNDLLRHLDDRVQQNVTLLHVLLVLL